MFYVVAQANNMTNLESKESSFWTPVKQLKRKPC